MWHYGAVQGGLPRNSGHATLGDYAGCVCASIVLQMILFPAVAVHERSSRRDRGLLLGELNKAAAPGCIGVFGGGEAVLVAGGITLQALAVLAHMREVVSVPVTVHVRRSDACGDRMRRRLPTVEIGRGSVVGGLMRLGGTDGV